MVLHTCKLLFQLTIKMSAYSDPSTICGHVFCKSCLENVRLASLRAQAYPKRTLCLGCRCDLTEKPVPCFDLRSNALVTAQALDEDVAEGTGSYDLLWSHQEFRINHRL